MHGITWTMVKSGSPMCGAELRISAESPARAKNIKPGPVQKKFRPAWPGPLSCRKIRARPSEWKARPGPILFLGLLLTQTKTQLW